jgi:hypothetical protein
MYNIKTYFTLIGLMTIISCNENKIVVAEDRIPMAEPDKELRINYEVNKSINLIVKEITNSDAISTCEHGKKLLNSGLEILPYLKEKFTDSTETKVYSTHNKRNLTFGELAIIVAGNIKTIPIAKVLGIQQCTPPIDLNIEHFLWAIKKNPKRFIENYNIWLKEEM